MKKQDFPENSYQTAEADLPSKPFRRLKMSRFLFTLRFIRTVIRSRSLAVKGSYDRNEWSRSSLDIMHLLEKSGGKFHINGFDNFRDSDEPLVFVSNHMSTLETMVFPCLIAPFMDVTFVVKDSLVNFPVFRHIMRSRDPIVVSRDNSRDDLIVVLKGGAKKLKSGISVIVFPQSTRRPFLKISEFNSLAVKLAAKNKVKVVPVAIKTDYWKRGRLISELGGFKRSSNDIYIEFGEAMEVEGTGKETQKKLIDFISKRLKSWNAEVIE